MKTKTLTKDQVKDTGLVIVLIMILLALFMSSNIYLVIAIVALLLAMLIPSLFHYPAIIWFKLADFISIFTSKILFGLVFFILVLPVGLIRKIFGIDNLMLYKFKKNSNSSFKIRNKLFVKTDLETPF